MPRPPKIEWTREQIAYIQAAWDSFTAGQIARAIFSKADRDRLLEGGADAVRRKAHALGLKPKPTRNAHIPLPARSFDAARITHPHDRRARQPARGQA